MAGIYIHIPFCRHACHYCDFHFSTNLTRMDEMHEAILRELELERGYLSEPVETIYFGGGTPSLYAPDKIEAIISFIKASFRISSSAEVTLEANPEDLTAEYLGGLTQTSINRLSIGVQTFNDPRLAFLNRKHTGREAIEGIVRAREAGYGNLTADLIMGIPPADLEDWGQDLDTMIGLDLPHLSLYSLTVEEKTVFGKWKKKGKLMESSEESMAAYYEQAQKALTLAGYTQYEVSNYAKKGHLSRHNSSYWAGAHYLGVGPGAHSYNGSSRSYNPSNNSLYLKDIAQGEPGKETEVLSQTQKMNERILTRMRTAEGLSITGFNEHFERDFVKDRDKEIDEMIGAGWIELLDGQLRPTPAGFLMADEITLRLFYDE